MHIPKKNLSCKNVDYQVVQQTSYTEQAVSMENKNMVHLPPCKKCKTTTVAVTAGNYVAMNKKNCRSAEVCQVHNILTLICMLCQYYLSFVCHSFAKLPRFH